MEGLAAGTSGGGYLTFATSPNTATGATERMRIDGAGNVGVNTTDMTITGGLVGTSSRFVVGGSVGRVQLSNTGNEIAFSRNSTNYISAVSGTSASINVQAGSAAGGGVILTNGATSWAAVSDERLKTTLTPFENAASKVCSLRAGTGRYLEDEEGVSRSFLIAQDVQAVLPEAVYEQEDEIKTLGLRYTDTIPLLVAAIQEQQAIINALKARLDAANL
jgi:hypothetical protein